PSGQSTESPSPTATLRHPRCPRARRETRSALVPTRRRETIMRQKAMHEMQHDIPAFTHRPDAGFPLDIDKPLVSNMCSDEMAPRTNPGSIPLSLWERAGVRVARTTASDTLRAPRPAPEKRGASVDNTDWRR